MNSGETTNAYGNLDFVYHFIYNKHIIDALRTIKMLEYKLLLSSDGDISLYHVTSQILENIDSLVRKFNKWKKTNEYDETLFVAYLRTLYGEGSITFEKTVGRYGGRIDPQTGVIEHEIAEKYRDLKWINF